VKYYGSMTRPPCTEGVLYYVLTKPQPISEGQYQHLRTRIHENRREVQPLNGREPVYYSTSGKICGNCIQEDGEECDLGVNNGGIGCRTNCTKPRCGDGIIDEDEECDNGTGNGAAGPCNQFCKWVTTCPATCGGKTSSCPSCVKAGSSEKPCCSSSGSGDNIENSGTMINVNFAGLLKGAGCTGPNCH